MNSHEHLQKLLWIVRMQYAFAEIQVMFYNYVQRMKPRKPVPFKPGGIIYRDDCQQKK